MQQSLRGLRDKTASSIGSIFEWYEFTLYGFFSPTLAQIFFPNDAGHIAIIKTLSISGIGFIARPFGALLFGYLSDKYGRTITLKLTPILITFPTLLIALLPGYEKIGVLSPALLLMYRITQGLVLGGEYSNNIVYLCETSRPKNLYFSGSLGSCASSLGILLASSVAALFYRLYPSDSMLTYGWRFAFLLSLPLGLLAYFMRRHMLETPVYQKIQTTQQPFFNPLTTAYHSQKREFLVGLGLTLLPATSFYFIFIFLPNYLNTHLHHNPDNVLQENSLSLLLRFALIPTIGVLADKIGGIKIARFSCILFLVLSYPLFNNIIRSETFNQSYLFIFALMTTLNASTTPGLLVELFRSETRCTLLSMTMNIAFGVVGGIVPAGCLILVNQSHNPVAPVLVLIISAVATYFATCYFNKEKVYEGPTLLSDHNL